MKIDYDKLRELLLQDFKKEEPLQLGANHKMIVNTDWLFSFLEKTLPECMEEEKEVCKKCEGYGYTVEHANHPHINGDCCGECPIQMQCDPCNGTGILPPKPQNMSKEIEVTGNCNSFK